MPAALLHILPDRPLVVASVNTPEDIPAAIACSDTTADIIEWRLDGLQALTTEEIHSAITACPLPPLLTARRHDEGGFAPWESESVRMQALQAHVRTGRWIDIESRSLAESRKWQMACKDWCQDGAGLLVSMHDFERIPTAAALAKAASEANSCGATIFKVAGTAHTLDDVSALGTVFHLAAPARLSVMAMGKFGRASRLLFATAGSVFNYGYLRAASVPGQWPAAGLMQALRDSGLR